MTRDDDNTTEGGDGTGARTGGLETIGQGPAGQSAAKARQTGPIAEAMGRLVRPDGGRDHRALFDPGIALDPTAEPAYRFVPDFAPDNGTGAS
ncbi:hypothetical protein [Stappia sp.]|uniref:hypothetical protein n=1 Tax=Stappia sp. TaxID=1870903 RepID=UPI003C7A38B7